VRAKRKLRHARKRLIERLAALGKSSRDIQRGHFAACMNETDESACQYWKSAVLGDVVRNVKCHINNAFTVLGLQTEAALLKHFQHRDIFGQDFRNQSLIPPARASKVR
jgi:hypothetical protein